MVWKTGKIIAYVLFQNGTTNSAKEGIRTPELL